MDKMCNFRFFIVTLFVLCAEIAHGQRAYNIWWSRPNPTPSPTGIVPGPGATPSPTPSAQPFATPPSPPPTPAPTSPTPLPTPSPVPTPDPTPVIQNPTRSPTVSGMCDIDLSIDIILMLDEDCLEDDTTECELQQQFIADIAGAIADSGSDVRLALIRHAQTNSSEVVFNFDVWERFTDVIVSDFLPEMPCSFVDKAYVDPYDTLWDAVALFDSDSDAATRARKILMVNNCDPSVQVDSLCESFPAVLDAFGIEVILINAGTGIDLGLYTCLVDDGQTHEEYFAFAEITQGALDAADDTIVNQLCSANDDAATTAPPTPGPTSEPGLPPATTPAPVTTASPTTPSPTEAPTSTCTDVAFDLDISILVDGRCALTSDECEAQNEFLGDVVSRIIPAVQSGTNGVRFNLIEIDDANSPDILLTFDGSDGMSVSDMKDEIDEFACKGTGSSTTIASGLLGSVAQFANADDNHERKMLVLSYCPPPDTSAADVCLWTFFVNNFGIDPILVNAGDLVDETTNECLVTDATNGVLYYTDTIDSDGFDSLVFGVSNRLCTEDSALNTFPPVPQVTDPPAMTTTDTPTTGVPTTGVPTTGVPTTGEPTTGEPTTRAPTTSEPTTRAPTTSEPTTEAPTTSEPTTHAPTTSEPTTRAPTTSEPTTRAPTTSEPTKYPTDRPTSSPTDRPTKYPTKNPTDRPTDSPTDRPTEYPTDRPTNSPTSEPTRAPTTSEPTTRAPTTSEPTTRAPTTSEPTTSAPTTSEPTTTAPTTSEPTTYAPTTSEPTTRAPTTHEPTTYTPTTSQPTTRAPTTNEPTTGAPSSSGEPSPYPTWFAPTGYPTWFEPTNYPTWYEPTNYPTWFEPTNQPTNSPTDRPTSSPTTPAPTTAPPTTSQPSSDTNSVGQSTQVVQEPTAAPHTWWGAGRS